MVRIPQVAEAAADTLWPEATLWAAEEAEGTRCRWVEEAATPWAEEADTRWEAAEDTRAAEAEEEDTLEDP